MAGGSIGLHDQQCGRHGCSGDFLPEPVGRNQEAAFSLDTVGPEHSSVVPYS